jgi:uncharacterized protein YyaL (SSP411 family)
MKHNNALVHESSPYLLQHAHNPVNWFPWGEEALARAREEDKPLVVSIGYSTCHWCHVMERESFEDEEVAALMNRDFVSIKVDREERPDIDQIFMMAVHLMNQRGGWPLNCIALPDGRPIWGGTYFPKEQWLSVLQQVGQFYRERKTDSIRMAERLAAGIGQQVLFQPESPHPILTREELREAVSRWSGQFDRSKGGMSRAPKFPLPVNLEFLLQYGHFEKDQEVLDFVDTTLLGMARGGIYDQVGGGFARYSVDRDWKVPHFEKMLYDNAQLLGLYALAHQRQPRDEYLEVIRQTVDYVEREMLGPEGLFYSALDADSEGEEGRYYTWTREELQYILGKDFEHFAAYYHVDDLGYWEAGRYILLRTAGPEEHAREVRRDPWQLRKDIRHWQDKLLAARDQRVPPGLDHKSLTAWNALMISGLVNVYRATGMPLAWHMARKAGQAVKGLLLEPGGQLYRNYTSGKASIAAYHSDYAFFIQACLDIYEPSLDPSWLEQARHLSEYCLDHFLDEESGLFHFHPRDRQVLISPQTEIQDNVLPSSNSVMALNLFRLGHFYSEPSLTDRAAQMLGTMGERIRNYPEGFASWGRLLLLHLHPFYEVAVSGPDALKLVGELTASYLPHALVAGTLARSELPLFRDRYHRDKNHIFVCRDNVCGLPVEKVSDAKAKLHTG